MLRGKAITCCTVQEGAVIYLDTLDQQLLLEMQTFWISGKKLRVSHNTIFMLLMQNNGFLR